MLVSVGGNFQILRSFFIKTREPFNLWRLHCIASNSRNCRISCGYLHTNRELTNEEKCQWRKLCHVLLYNTTACWRDITSLTDCSEVHMGFYYCSASKRFSNQPCARTWNDISIQMTSTHFVQAVEHHGMKHIKPASPNRSWDVY